MKVAIVTDTHCGAGNDNAHLNEFFLQFFEKIFFPYLKQHRIDTVIHLGDVFDRRKYVNFNTLHTWHERVFRPLSDMCSRVDILIGNHDTYFKTTNAVNSVDELLKHYSNFNVFQNSSEVEVGGKSILYVPWICEENFSRTMSAIEASSASICMGHLELIGFEMYAGHINADKGLGANLFDKFYMTLSGHFHQKSSVGSTHYLGAPYAMMWGDYGSPRGFHVLDTETMQLSFVENPIKMFHKVFYDDSEATLEGILGTDFSAYQEKFVKLVVQSKTNPYWFDQFYEALQKVNPADLSVIESSIDSGVVGEIDIDQAKDTLTILVECANDLNAGDHKQMLNDLLRELYIQALSSNEHMQSNS